MRDSKPVKVFALNITCDGRGLYIDSSKPSDMVKAEKVMKQFNITPETCLKVQSLFDTMNKALFKLMRE